MTAITTIGLLGFGEVGQRLAADLSTLPQVSLNAFDILFAAADSVPSVAVRERSGVRKVGSPRELASNCDLVVSAVTASEVSAATQSIVSGLKPGAFVLDVNSVAPATRRRAAAVVENAGGRYVEAAVMSPIEPAGIASPLLLGGPHAAEFQRCGELLGFSGTSVCSPDIGVASATKMCRSIMVKGLEALFAESLLTARHYGVEEGVLASLDNLLGSRDWQALARYMIQRSIEHGARRAEEMGEAAATVTDAGVEPWMSRACGERQEWAAGCRAGLQHTELGPLLDAMRGEAKC